MTTKLSDHFSKEEFEESQWASRRDVLNKMNEEQTCNAVDLCNEVLEKIRAHFKAPIIISSGFRGEELNKGVGGSVSSQHCRGEAADIKVIGHSPYEVACWIVEEANLDFDQCIYEYDSWVHVSFTTRYANRKQYLTINSDGVSQGINV